MIVCIQLLLLVAFPLLLEINQRVKIIVHLETASDWYRYVHVHRYRGYVLLHCLAPIFTFRTVFLQWQSFLFQLTKSLYQRHFISRWMLMNESRPCTFDLYVLVSLQMFVFSCCSRTMTTITQHNDTAQPKNNKNDITQHKSIPTLLVLSGTWARLIHVPLQV